MIRHLTTEDLQEADRIVRLAFGNRILLIQKIFRYVAGALSLVIGFNVMYQIEVYFKFFN